MSTCIIICIYIDVYISDPLVRDPPTYPKYRELLCHRKSCVAGELCTLLVLLSCILRNVRHWILYLRSTYGWTLPVKYVRECSTSRFTCCIPWDDWFTCVWGLPVYDSVCQIVLCLFEGEWISCMNERSDEWCRWMVWMNGVECGYRNASTWPEVSEGQLAWLLFVPLILR